MSVIVTTNVLLNIAVNGFAYNRKDGSPLHSTVHVVAWSVSCQCWNKAHVQLATCPLVDPVFSGTSTRTLLAGLEFWPSAVRWFYCIICSIHRCKVSSIGVLYSSIQYMLIMQWLWKIRFNVVQLIQQIGEVYFQWECNDRKLRKTSKVTMVHEKELSEGVLELKAWLKTQQHLPQTMCKMTFQWVSFGLN